MRKANRAWTAAERRAVLENAPPQLELPIAIGMFTAFREGDLVKLPRDAVTDDGWLVARTGKAGTEVQWPIHSTLSEIIARAPPHDAVTLCASSRGTPWTEDGFRASFSALIRRLEARGLVGSNLTFHGLRHSVGALLKDDGASDEDIAIALGHRSPEMARHYSRSASTRKRMGEVVKLFDPLKRNGNGNGS